MPPRSRRPRPASLGLNLLGLLLGLAGCEEPRHVKTGANGAAAPAPTPEPAPASEVVQPREILGQRTQDIRDAQTELSKKGANVASQKIVARDPITLPGNAYVSIVGRNSILNIKHAIDLYQAETGQYPKDYNQFMEEIIKKNNIALPKLPYYQEYGYNAEKHELIVLEYPDRKAAVQKQDDAKYGR